MLLLFQLQFTCSVLSFEPFLVLFSVSLISFIILYLLYLRVKRTFEFLFSLWVRNGLWDCGWVDVLKFFWDGFSYVFDLNRTKQQYKLIYQCFKSCKRWVKNLQCNQLNHWPTCVQQPFWHLYSRPKSVHAFKNTLNFIALTIDIVMHLKVAHYWLC